MKANDSPHIIMLLLDGLRFDVMQESTVFNELKSLSCFCNNVVTYAPYTTASMHAILSGMYGTRNGVHSYYTASQFRYGDVTTLPMLLGEHNYYTSVDINNKKTIPYKAFSNVTEYDEFDKKNRDMLYVRHIDTIQNALKGKVPFYLELHNLILHAELINKFKNEYSGDKEDNYFENPQKNREEYKSYAEKTDTYVQKILEYLSWIHFFKDNLLIILSDHGCSLGEKPGERMYGTYLEDYTIKTFIYFVGEPWFEKSSICSSLLRTVDIMPTILDICTIPSTGKSTLNPDGVSLLQNKTDREAFVETAPLAGDFPSPYIPNYHGIITNRYKMLYHSSKDENEFYIRNNSTWAPMNPKGPDFENLHFKMCRLSPLVNRKMLNKIS